MSIAAFLKAFREHDNFKLYLGLLLIFGALVLGLLVGGFAGGAEVFKGMLVIYGVVALIVCVVAGVVNIVNWFDGY